MKRHCILIAALMFSANAIAWAQESATQPQESIPAAEPDLSGDATTDDATSDEAATEDDGADASTETPAAGAAATTTQAADGQTTTGGGEAAYGVRIRELEGQLDELKEDVFRSKSRLYLLREQIVQDSVGNARAVIEHVNEFGKTFELLEVRYSLDGTPIYSATSEDGNIDDVERLELYNGVVLPGVHNLAVQMVVRGKPRGPFTYARGYEFEVTTSHAFSVEGGQVVDLDIVTYSGGNAHEDFSRRPDVRFDEQVASAGGEATPSAARDEQTDAEPASSEGTAAPNSDSE